METAKFNPNKEDIAKRASISRFGRAATYETEQPQPVEFILEHPEAQSAVQEEVKTEIYQAAKIYSPPIASSISYTPPSDVSVKITNIPLNLTFKEFHDLLVEKCKGRPFIRCNLVFDKVTKISRGLAYVTFENIEKAREFVKIAKTIVIDSFILSAEIVAAK